MTKQEGTALVSYTPRAMQRKVERQTDLMKAKADVGKAVIDSGTEIHNYAGAKVVEAAQFSHLMLQVAEQGLNGSYPALETVMCHLGANYQAFVAQCVGQHMSSMLRQAEDMPINPEVGLLGRIGDGLAEGLDEWERSRLGG